MTVLSRLHYALILLISKLRKLFTTDSRNAWFLYNDFATFRAWQVSLPSPPRRHWTDNCELERATHPDNAAYVYKIKFCKQYLFSEHEFLVCYLRESETTPDRYQRKSVILIERNGDSDQDHSGDASDRMGTDEGSDSPAPTTLEPNIPAPPHSTSAHTHIRRARVFKSFQQLASPIVFFKSLASSVLSDLMKLKKRGDILAFTRTGGDDFVNGLEGPYKICAVLTLPDQTFTLLHLITLVTTVHDSHCHYTADVYNCRWYASTIYDSIRKIVPGSTEGATVQILEKLLQLISSGKASKSIADYDMYKTALEATNQKIEAIHTRRDEPLKAERERRIKAEERLVKAEDGELAERERRVKAEERRVKVEERQLELETKLAKLEAQAVSSQPSTSLMPQSG